MDHYVAYHKTDERGPYFEQARRNQDRELRFSTKNRNILAGSRLWVFTGRSSPRVYELVCSGIIRRIERGTNVNDVVFNVDYFPKPIEVTKAGWFQQLMTSQANFARGLSKINGNGAVAALEEMRVADELDAFDNGSTRRLPAETLGSVTAEHIWNAIKKLGEPGFNHGYGPSTDFDLVTEDGERFPPKAVFGLAATEALGFDVLPKHFLGGRGTACFRILENAGYTIVPKDEDIHPIELPVSQDDRLWTEGEPRLVAHLRRERASGLAQAKRNWFVRTHGRLFCERCGLDPVVTYSGVHRNACIEVHHNVVSVADMIKGHDTKLDDLQCLCANCHRVVHRLLKLELEKQTTFVSKEIA
jgi:hypothetical protein